MRKPNPILSILVLAGCGGGGGGGGDLALDDMPAAFAAGYCEKLFACCTSAEIQERLPFNPPITDEADCTEQLTLLYMGFLSQPVMESEQAGKLVYDGAAAGTCLDTLESMSCAAFAVSEGPGTDCADPFVGQVANGGACSWDEDCESNYCEGDSFMPEMDGTCRARPGSGEPCPDFVCGDGLYCEFGAMGSMCTARKADGAECYSGDECQANACNGVDTTMGTPGTCGAPTECTGA